jgi:carbonic anhydrase
VRNAGARLTSDALRSLALATHLLGVTRILVVIHTDCAMGCTTDEEVRERVRASDPDAAAALDGVELFTTADPRDTLRSAVEELRSSRLVAPGVTVGGFQYDVHTGLLERLV